MAIEVRHTDIGDIARLGVLAGKSVAAQKEIEYARTVAREAQRMAHEKEMAIFRAQLDIEAAKRSHQWEFEKMEIRSRLDFEREERERMRRLDDADNALRQIDREVESGRITNEQADTLRFYQEMKQYGAAPPISLIQPPREERPRRITPSEQMRAYKMLQEEEFEEPSWYEKPFGLGKLTEEELFYKEMLEKIARGEPTTPTGIPTTAVDETNIEPRNEQEFYDIVARLKAIDVTKAKVYYNKWAGRF